MIALQLLAAAVTVVPGPAPNNAHDLIAGAEHAIKVNRLEQAGVMAARALGSGASGRDMDRLLADLAFAKERYAEALARYRVLLKSEPANPDFLEHAGLAAAALGDKVRANAAFTQALEVSGTWYARAANNLKAYANR
jgi:Flp pilus assembly protein TadD